MAKSSWHDEIKKAGERKYLDSFKQIYGKFPVGEVTHTEEPDFIVGGGKASVGIELTELHRETDGAIGKPLRGLETERDLAVKGACKLYQENVLPPIDVAVTWFEHYPLSRKRRLEIEKELADLVKGSIPNENENCMLKNTGLPDELFPKEVNTIRIFRMDHSTQNHWAVHSSGYIGELHRDQVAQIIRNKETKLDSYKQQCTRAWLLIILDGSRVSSLLDIPPSLTQEIFETGFEKVLLLRYFEREVIELVTEDSMK